MNPSCMSKSYRQSREDPLVMNPLPYGLRRHLFVDGDGEPLESHPTR